MRYLKNKYRWLGFSLAVISVFILSGANVATQWIGWTFSVIACVMWVYFGYKDKDWPRTLMECMYLILSIRAVFNWLGI
tara:strand:+ start:142 stop:378 length:237 start_codon:yes stop_codon:yes gene_type:complete